MSEEWTKIGEWNDLKRDEARNIGCIWVLCACMYVKCEFTCVATAQWEMWLYLIPGNLMPVLSETMRAYIHFTQTLIHTYTRIVSALKFLSIHIWDRRVACSFMHFGWPVCGRVFGSKPHQHKAIGTIRYMSAKCENWYACQRIHCNAIHFALKVHLMWHLISFTCKCYTRFALGHFV